MALKDTDAAEILRRCGCASGRGTWWDFHALPTSTVAALVAEANAAGYRAPKNANSAAPAISIPLCAAPRRARIRSPDA
jgi:hypothetical protein